MSMRKAINIRSPRPQREGGGFIVKRSINPGQVIGGLFLLFDHLDYTIPAGVGFPGVMHPHRGFETVGYQLQGKLVHTCMSGVEGVMTPGDAQWMTAGRGVVHGGGSEETFKRTGGPVEAFQIWINLPKASKMVAPRYQDVQSKDIPIVHIPNGKAGSTVKVVSGQYEGVSGACSTLYPVQMLDVRLQEGDKINIPISAEHVAFLYVYRGAAALGYTEINAGQRIELVDGDFITVSTSDKAELVDVHAPHSTHDKAAAAFIILSGQPILDPVVAAGPFVMNSEEEIQQCFEDYRSGKMAAESRVKEGEL